MTSDHCATCGRKRGGLPRFPSFSHTSVIEVRDHLTLQPGRAEESPQLTISLHVYRNGGTGEQTHLCVKCLNLGLRLLRERIDALLPEED